MEVKMHKLLDGNKVYAMAVASMKRAEKIVRENKHVYFWAQHGVRLAYDDGRKPCAGVTHKVPSHKVLCGLHAYRRLEDLMCREWLYWRVWIVQLNEKEMDKEPRLRIYASNERKYLCAFYPHIYLMHPYITQFVKNPTYYLREERTWRIWMRYHGLQDEMPYTKLEFDSIAVGARKLLMYSDGFSYYVDEYRKHHKERIDYIKSFKWRR